MAHIHTLLTSVSNLNLCIDSGNRLLCCDTIDALARRRGHDRKKKSGNGDFLSGCRSRVSAIGQPWRLCAATELRVVQESSSKNTTVQNQVPFIEIPVTCYQIIGVHDRAEKDEIVKSVMHLKNAEIEEGYTKEAVISRQDLLMDVRDKLLFEPEYAGNFKEKQPPKSSLKIPWAWLPGALCLLQEVGNEKLVLEIGGKALQHPESKLFVHDLLLSMALAECAIAKVGFEKNNISQGFEALARAQCLLRSKISLGKMMLLSQIEESLEELAPACTLDLLGMPHAPENAERRLGAIAALRELLRQGLDIETSCQVEDWPCFLNQALRKLMATEIVELISWDSLALTRKNRKSLESQNQRVVIDFNSFYMVLLAHIALGFSSKQTELITKAKSICECLIASEGIDIKFEEAFCSFLLGQGDEATAIERLRQLELSSSPSSQKSLQMKETREVSSANKPLETWLKESVLGLFPDTRDCSPSLDDFFIGEKRASGKRQNKKSPPTLSNMRLRSLAGALPLDQRDEETFPVTESSRHLGPAVKQLAPPNLQSPLIESKAVAGSNVGSPSIQLKRTLGSKQGEVWKTWLSFSHVVGKMTYATALGCILIVLFKLINMQVYRPGNGSKWRMDGQRISLSSPNLTDSPVDFRYTRAKFKQNGITGKIRNVLAFFKNQPGDSESADLQTASLSSGLSSTSTYRQPMPVEDAETLVKRWQEIKAEALGPNHNILGLVEILEGSMLVQWQALADAAKERSCFWRFVLLQLKIVHADVLKDAIGREMAEIEVLLEEAAELVDELQPKNPTYYSPYKIRYLLKRQDDGSWRFCDGDILTPS
ncbi:plastid division protein cdp1 chloroplastic [Phtheirospermum japonicum]|uniref:Plastid division protein cdp1 chloroplastic n=1 Tax=Phtheirospermum japonicum TaxID=374723 RepID=A0A830BRH8_9LAMI|nr:plastid division protein cdp1 chloroplastic [Phtheirospermum japonicum]